MGTEAICVVIAATVAYAVLFLVTKLIGYRQISQLSVFEYVNGITIGSIAAELATELENPLRPLIAMAVMGVLSFLMAMLTARSLTARRLLGGTTLVLMENGTLFRDNFRKCKLDINEFLAQCHENGYFDLRQIRLALMETDGKVTFLPQSEARPATPQDLGLKVEAPVSPLNVVLDGQMLEGNLTFLGFDREWLESQLKVQGTTVATTFLATLERDGTLTVYPKENAGHGRDLYR